MAAKDLEGRRLARERQRELLAVWYTDLKSKLRCACGESHPACLQFHHRDPRTKSMSISDAIQRRWGTDRLRAEIDKCDVVCANCHYKLHAREVAE